MGKEEPATDERVRVRAALREIVAAFRSRWRTLLVVALALFVPLSLITSLGSGEGIVIEEWDGASTVAAIGIGALGVALPLLGTVLYSGMVCAVYVHRRSGVEHDLGHVARNLPYLRLIAADLLLVLAVLVGLILFLVPGLVLLAWFSLVAPIIELERREVRAAFGRSRALVRRSFWPVFALAVPASFLQSAIEGGGESLGVALVGESYLGEVVGSVAGNVLSAPIFALTVLVLYHDLLEIEQRRSAAVTPAEEAAA